MQTHVLTGFEAGPEIVTGPRPTRKETRVLPRSDNDAAGDQTPGGDALEVVLERTRRGEDELAKPVFGLGLSRLRLLAAIDGRNSLNGLATADAELVRQRLVRDAARLVAFGLAKQVRGELPREYLVAAMNLTVRIPRAAVFAQAEPEKAAAPAAPMQAQPQAPVVALAAAPRPTTVLKAGAQPQKTGAQAAPRRAGGGHGGRLIAALAIAAAVVAVALFLTRL